MVAMDAADSRRRCIGMSPPNREVGVETQVIIGNSPALWFSQDQSNRSILQNDEQGVAWPIAEKRRARSPVRVPGPEVVAHQPPALARTRYGQAGSKATPPPMCRPQFAALL